MTVAPKPSARPSLSLPATAFITGAVVMALEILGSRLLAPVFGNSLFVWGALIGVILAAMSSGYATGGWLADRYPGGTVLASLLVISGTWTFLLAGVGQPVMFTVSRWVQDPRWGPCLAGTVLLAPPAFCLSGVLPALLRLSIVDLGHLGRHTGRMIAISTIGSLLGTWGTAFYLLTWLGTMALVTLLGAVQLSLGMLWWWRAMVIQGRVVAKVGGTVLLALAYAGMTWFALHPVMVLSAPLYQEDTPYQQLRIREDDLFRYLILDRTFHAVMWKSDPVALYLPYSQAMMAALALQPHPSRALILGHGGGSLAKWLGRHWPELEVDTVEVDPAVVRAAEGYFGYRPPRTHHVHVTDARMFLQATNERYDIIWVDVFARHLIPFHLTTQEFFALLRTHLNADGVLAVNLASSGDGADVQRAAAVAETLRTVFPVIRAFGVKGPWKSGQSDAENIIFFAGPSAGQITRPEFVAAAQQLVAANRLPIETLTLIGDHVRKEWPRGTVLTDDYAPYDLLVGRATGEQGAVRR